MHSFRNKKVVHWAQAETSKDTGRQEKTAWRLVVKFEWIDK